MDTDEHLSFLAGSVNRVRVLGELRECSGRGAELARRCSLPRSTVHRALDGATSRGWTKKENGSYRLTTAGAHVLAAYEEFAETTEIANEYGEILCHLGAVGRTIPTDALASATVVEATAASPYAAMEHFLMVHRAIDPERVRGTIPIASRSFNEAARPLVEREVTVEMVISETVLATARETHPEAYRFGRESDCFSLFVHEEPIEFGLSIVDDDRVLLGAYDDRGALRACIDGTNEALIDWAIATFDECRAEAHPLATVRPESTPVES